MKSTKFLSCFDDKMRILNNGYDGLALSYEKTIIFVTIQNSFLSSYIGILVFYFIMKAFLLPYKIISLF